MTTFIIKRDVVWIESLPTNDNSSKIELLGKDGCQVIFPAVLLLATSPLVRSILTDHHLPIHSPLSLSLPSATEDVLHAVRDILARGTASGVKLERVNKVNEVFNMLRIEVSVDLEVPESETQIHELSEMVADDVKKEISLNRMGGENIDETSACKERSSKISSLCCSMEDGEYIENHEKMEKEETLAKLVEFQHIRQKKQPSVLGTARRSSLRPSMAISLEEENTVTAFGHPLSSLPRASFRLPWDINSKDSPDVNVKEYSSRKSRPSPMSTRQMPNKRHISYFCLHCHQRFSSRLEKLAHSRQMSCYSPF